MAIYKLTYAEENLAELFQQAHDGGDVFIMRADGASCQLVPMAAELEEPSMESRSMLEPVPLGDLAPA
jgi:antitoxin (DNA-binding transcriptional repressor) of toxin-antitoxin stability system